MNSCLFSSATVEWATPQALFDELDAEFHFDLDPCCTHENAKCAEHFTKAEINVDREEVEDTEKRHWAYNVVCNRCCATSGLTYLPEKAREAWNRRAEHE